MGAVAGRTEAMAVMLRMLKGGSLVLYRKVPFLYNHVLKIGRHDAQDIYLTLFYPLGVK